MEKEEVLAARLPRGGRQTSSPRSATGQNARAHPAEGLRRRRVAAAVRHDELDIRIPREPAETLRDDGGFPAHGDDHGNHVTGC
jgi:hypothetical protein